MTLTTKTHEMNVENQPQEIGMNVENQPQEITMNRSIINQGVGKRLKRQLHNVTRASNHHMK